MKHIYPLVLAVLFATFIDLLLPPSARAAPDAVITVSGNISSDTTWTNGNVYYVTGDVTVLAGVTLTLEPGVIVKFQNSRRLIIDGKLVAAGTSGQPIYFTSYRDDSVGGDTNGDGSSSGAEGDWGWIQFKSGSDDTSLIEYATIRYGGGWQYGNVFIQNASPTIRNSTLSHSYGDGIYLESTLSAGSSSPTLNNNMFSNNTASISTDITSWPTLTGNTSSNNSTNGLLVRGGTIGSNTAWNQTNMVYRVGGDVTVAGGATLTIAPGMIVKFNGNVKLLIDGKLVAAGTSGQLIYFTSYRDDSVGGDTNGDGSSSGAKGNWGWIQFKSGSDDTSLIEYATIRYGGGWQYGNVFIQDASPTIRNSTLSYSSGDGIYAQNATPTLVCNDIMSNGTLGIRNVSPSTVIDAINQYWGSPSGPKHTTLNPNGQGNGVSDGVSFIPWRTTPCGTPSFSLFLPVMIR